MAAGLATGGFTVRRTTLPADVILKVNINVIGATKTLKFDGTCTVREAMRLIAHKCLLSVSEEDLETQFVLYKPDGDFDGTYLENHSSYLSANNLQNQDWIEFRRRPTKLVVQNLTNNKESLLVDFDASISSLILFLSKKYNYKEPEKLELYLQARPDEALQLGLSLVEQGVEAGACVLLLKKEKQTKMSIFRKRPGSNYPGPTGGVVRPWQPLDRGSSGPRALIFGGSLEDALLGRELPPLMVKCITYVKERGIDKEGIFRLSGSAVAIEGFKRAFNEGHDVDLNNCLDIHVVCGLLKQFLRELREPLLTFDLYDTFLETGCQLEAVKGVLARLPELNVRVLKYLLGFLAEVASHSAANKMPMHNLATVFAPNLLRMREENIFRIVQDTPAANGLTSFLIQNFPSLFPASAGSGSVGAAAGARFAATATQQQQQQQNGHGGRGSAQGGPEEGTDYVSYVRVSYSYEPQDSSEMTLTQGEILGVLQDHESGWWKGEVLDPTTLAPSGTIGIFPVTYCETYEPPSSSSSSSSSGAATAPATTAPATAATPATATATNEAAQEPPTPVQSQSSSASLLSSQPPTTTASSQPSSSSLSKSTTSPRQLRFGATPSSGGGAGSGIAVSPRANGLSQAGGGGSGLGTSAGSAITTSNVKRPTTPTTGSFIGVPSSTRQAGESLSTTPRAGLAPALGRGKFATMRPPPLTPAEVQAQLRGAGGSDGAGGGQWEAVASPGRTPRSPPSVTVAHSAASPVGSPGPQPRGLGGGRPTVPPKELKPRLISTYVPAGGRRPSDATAVGGLLGNEATAAGGAGVVDWEKEAHRLRGLLEKEQQARSELERRVQELELELQTRS